MHDYTVRQFIIDEFLPDVRADELDSGFDLIESGIIDSLGLLKVIAWLESSFQIAIDVVDMVPENFASVDAISAFLDRNGEPALSAVTMPTAVAA